MAQDRVTSIGAEVLHKGDAKGRVTSVASEVLHKGNALSRVTSVAAEILIRVQRVAFTGFGKIRHRNWVEQRRGYYRRRYAPVVAAVVINSFTREHRRFQQPPAPRQIRRRFSPIQIFFAGHITLLWGPN